MSRTPRTYYHRRTTGLLKRLVLLGGTLLLASSPETSAQPAGRSPAKMQEKPADMDTLGELFAPVLTLPPVEPESVEGRIAGEGLSLPPAEVIVSQALPWSTVAAVGNDALQWIGKVVRPEWVCEDLPARIYAVRRLTAGEDGFVAACKIRERRIQIIVTSSRIHVLVSLLAARTTSVDAGEFALGVGNETLQFSHRAERSGYLIRNFRGLVLGKRVRPPFVRTWQETGQFLTDGHGVKWSFLKLDNRTSDPKSPRPPGDPVPWFPESPAP